MLRRYWIVVNPSNRYGAGNFDVTGYTSETARSLLREKLQLARWSNAIIESLDDAEIVEDIDIRLLDEGHVIPNIGVVTFPGVWFPNLNV